MLIELAHFCFFIILALWGSQIILNMLLLYQDYYEVINFYKITAPLLVFCLFTLLYSFYISDFSLLLVVENSSSLKPPLYRMASLWSSYQGSLFLWLCLIGLFSWNNWLGGKEKLYTELVLASLMLIIGLFIELVANPFVRLMPAPFQGQDSSPLLEDLSLAIHPPLLYLAYANLSISFAFAIGAMLLGESSKNLHKALAFYNKIGLLVLSLSIVMGSYWAYYELGWGGYWSFDPVENSALMPWLASLAVFHLMEKNPRRAIFFSLLCFSLILSGSFIARSNFVFSVHSFMANFTQSIAIIILILLLLIPAWVIFYSHKVVPTKNLHFFTIIIRAIIISLLFPQILSLLFHNIYVTYKYYYYSFIPLCLLAIAYMIYASRKFSWSMLFGHGAIIIIALAICLGHIFSSSEQIMVKPGQIIYIHGIAVKYCDKHLINNAEYYGYEYDFAVKNTIIKTQIRNYILQKQQTTIIGLANDGLSQLYIVPQSSTGDNLLIRIDYNYAILAIWLGGLLGAFGVALIICKWR